MVTTRVLFCRFSKNPGDILPLTPSTKQIESGCFSIYQKPHGHLKSPVLQDANQNYYRAHPQRPEVVVVVFRFFFDRGTYSPISFAFRWFPPTGVGFWGLSKKIPEGFPYPLLIVKQVMSPIFLGYLQVSV